MNEYKAYAKQTNKRQPLPISNDPYENYILAKLDRNRMILYEDHYENLIQSAAEKVAGTALDLINSFSV